MKIPDLGEAYQQIFQKCKVKPAMEEIDGKHRFLCLHREDEVIFKLKNIVEMMPEMSEDNKYFIRQFMEKRNYSSLEYVQVEERRSFQKRQISELLDPAITQVIDSFPTIYRFTSIFLPQVSKYLSDLFKRKPDPKENQFKSFYLREEDTQVRGEDCELIFILSQIQEKLTTNLKARHEFRSKDQPQNEDIRDRIKDTLPVSTIHLDKGDQPRKHHIFYEKNHHYPLILLCLLDISKEQTQNERCFLSNK